MLTPLAHNRRFTTVDIVVTGDSASAQIAAGNLVVIKDNARADGSDTNSVQATVTDAHDNPLAGQTVSFHAGNGATIAAQGITGSDGSVTVTLTNTTAGRSTVTATVNANSSQQQAVNFIADNSTARIASGDMVVMKDHAKANGIDTNRVQAKVTDAHGNPLADQKVEFSANNGATIAAQGITGNDGSVTVTLTSTTAGQTQVTASIKGSSQQQMLTFDADSTTAQIASGDLVMMTDNAKANGIDSNSVKATVTDGHGNRVANLAVSFSADNGATMATSGITDASGEVTMTITSTTVGQSTVTATVGASSQHQTLNFVADDATAHIANGNLLVLSDNALADGKATNSVKAIVTDAHGNALAGQTVGFNAGNGAIITASGITGNDGSVTVTLTSTTAGQTQVTASINGSSQHQTLTFMADSSTPQITNGNLLVVSDNAVADGKATNSVKAIVTDAHGNTLTGQKVDFTASNGATIAASGITGNDGSVTVTLTSTTAGQTQVTASINGSSQHQTLTFMADSSTPQITNGNLLVVSDNAVADGKATNSVKAIVTDAHGNTLSGQKVDFTASNGATIPASGITGNNGSVTVTLTSTTAGQTQVTASINGSSQHQTLTFMADSSTPQITNGNLLVVSDNAVADGKATNSVKAIVTDAHGNTLSGQKVDFTASNGATIPVSGITGNDGSVTVTLTSTTAGQTQVTASINGSSQHQTLTFVADNSTAQIASGDLLVVSDNAIADGSATNSVKAVVKDAKGNLLSGQKVDFTADNGATIAANGITGNDGSVTVTLTSTTAGQTQVTASINGSHQTQSVTFMADSSTPQITNGNLQVVSDNAVADGKATNSVKAIVTDAHGNPLTGQKVDFTASNGATIAASGITGSDGSVTVTLTSIKAGQVNVTATVNGTIQSQSVTFVGDSATAHIASGDLLVVSDNAIADGSTPNSVKATVTDSNGNAVAGQKVDFTADNGATIAAQGITGSDGSVTMQLTSTIAGQTQVTASINGSRQSQTLTFIADNATAQIASGNLLVVSDNAMADGTAVNSVKAIVTDAHGNILTGQTVKFSANNGATIAASGTTVSDGSVTVTLTSTTAGQTQVTATINGNSQTVAVTFAADGNKALLASLTVEKDNEPADGSATNSVKAMVTDASGAPLPGLTVNFSATNGAIIQKSATTGSDGSATVTLFTFNPGQSQVTATINGTSKVQSVTFSETAYTLTVAQKNFNNASYQFNLRVTDVVANKLTAASQGSFSQELTLGENLTVTCPAGTKKYGQDIVLIDGSTRMRFFYQGVTQFSPFTGQPYDNGIDVIYSNVEANDPQNYPLDKVTASQWVSGGTHTFIRNTVGGRIRVTLTFSSSTYDLGSYAVQGNGTININMGNKKPPLLTTSANQIQYLAGYGPCN